MQETKEERRRKKTKKKKKKKEKKGSTRGLWVRERERERRRKERNRKESTWGEREKKKKKERVLLLQETLTTSGWNLILSFLSTSSIVRIWTSTLWVRYCLIASPLWSLSPLVRSSTSIVKEIWLRMALLREALTKTWAFAFCLASRILPITLCWMMLMV